QRGPDRARLRADRRTPRRARRERPPSGDRAGVSAAGAPDQIPLREPIDDFTAFGVRAFTTTRVAGDYGLGDGDPEASALARWQALHMELAAVAPRLASARQVHGTNILEHGAGWEG